MFEALQSLDLDTIPEDVRTVLLGLIKQNGSVANFVYD